MHYTKYALVGLLLIFPIKLWAAPDTSMSITPTATASTTITAADENSRNNSITTTYDSHDHNDINDLANSVNLGDGTAGNKTLTANAADTSDQSIRWNDASDLWTIQQDSTTYNTIAHITEFNGLASNGVVIGNGNGALTAVIPGVSGTFLRSEGANTDPSWVEGYAIENFSRAAATASGSDPLTGAGFPPSFVHVICVSEGTTAWSTGFGYSDTSESIIHSRQTGGNVRESLTQLALCSDGTDSQIATLTSLDATGMTLAWIKSASGLACSCRAMYFN